MANFKAADDFGAGYFDSDDISDGERAFKTVRGAASDLSRRRFREYLDPGETREAISAYRAGDRTAGDRLVRAYARLVRKCAKGIYGPSHEDVIGAGMEALSRALLKCDLRRNTSFAAYAKPVIRGAMLDLARLGRQQGTGDDRASRFLFGHPDANAVEVALACKISVETAQAAINGAARHSAFVRYDALAHRATYPGVFGGRHKLAHHLRQSDLALAVRNDTAVERQLRNVPRGSRSKYRTGQYLADAACFAQQLYELRRIRQIGRQGYAEELVSYERARPRHAMPLRAEAIPPGETAQRKAPVPEMFVELLLNAKRRQDQNWHGEFSYLNTAGLSRAMRLHPSLNTETSRQTKEDSKCPKCKPFQSLLQQSTQYVGGDCSPLVPRLAQSQDEKSRLGSSAT